MKKQALLFRLKREKDFIEAVINIYQDYDLLSKMKHNAYEQNLKHSSEGAFIISINNKLEEII